MALPDILRNVGTALDRVENYIDGVDTTFNPKNTLNGIRISLTTVRGHMQRHAQDAINLQGLLHIANGRINNLMNDLANTRNDVLQRTQLLTLAYNNEVNERRHWWQIARERQTNGQRIAFRKQNRINVLLQEKGVLQILVRRCKAEADLAEFNRAWVFNRYQKWKARELNSRQIILNLQNNPLGNMAALQDVMSAMAPLLAREDAYIGQEPPDDYFDRISQILAYGDTLGVGAYNNAIKTNVLASKMAGRFVPSNPFNNAECGGQVWEESEKPPIQQISPSSQALAIQPQKDSQAEHDFIVRLAKDLDYLGVATNLSVLGPHIYDELGKRLGRKTAHVR
ncbi:unnamed protein product [Rhizophagus irregularis]|nr:unnamed protein product [Rhizophagus irregularis]